MTDKNALDEQVSNIIANQHLALPPTHAFILDDAVSKDEEGYIGELKDDGYESSALGVEDETVKSDGDDEEECMGNLNDEEYQLSELGVEEITNDKNNKYGRWKIGALVAICSLVLISVAAGVGARNKDKGTAVYGETASVIEVPNENESENVNGDVAPLPSVCLSKQYFEAVMADAVEEYSCNLDIQCDGNLADTGSCGGNTGTICDGSCNSPDEACKDNQGDIQSCSCLGSNSCNENEGDVRLFSCNGKHACKKNIGTIGTLSCNGKNKACYDNHGDVAAQSCNALKSCLENEGEISSESCNKSNACEKNEGPIAEKSCNGPMSCLKNSGAIGAKSCNGEKSCCGNTEDRGSGECNEDFECCNSNVSQCECPNQTDISSAVASLASLVSETEETPTNATSNSSGASASEASATENNSNSTSLENEP